MGCRFEFRAGTNYGLTCGSVQILIPQACLAPLRAPHTGTNPTARRGYIAKPRGSLPLGFVEHMAIQYSEALEEPPETHERAGEVSEVKI